MTTGNPARKLRAVFRVYWCFALACALLVSCLGSCTNNPYPTRDAGEKVLYRPFTEAPKTLDPAVAYTTTAHDITGLVNATLLEYHYLKRPYTLIPGLALTVPVAAEDGSKTRYRFELRPDLVYQDDDCFTASNDGQRSRSVVAGDVAFELMRIADASVNSPAYEAFANVEGTPQFRKRLGRLRDTGQVAGLTMREQYQRAGGIAGVVVRSATQLDLVMSRPPTALAP